MYGYPITVFTPSYNRAYILENAYRSLTRQTMPDFEWLIIDDGSTDNTEELVRKFIDEQKIRIRYYKKSNGGKHTAVNMGVEKAEGKLFLILDSDDYLKDTALERVLFWENTIKNENQFGGVSGLKVFENGVPIGQKWLPETDYVDALAFEKDRKKYGLLGDKAEAYYTDVLRKFCPLPVYEGERDVEIGVLWNRVANAGYKVRWFREGIYVCEYLEDGLSANSVQLHLKNFKGFTCWKKELIDMQTNYINVVRETSSFVGLASLKGLNVAEMAKAIGRKPVTVWLAKVHLALHKLKQKSKGK